METEQHEENIESRRTKCLRMVPKKKKSYRNRRYAGPITGGGEGARSAQLPNLEKLFVTDSSHDIGVSTIELHLQVKVFTKDNPTMK